LQIPLLDHLVFTHTDFYSFRNNKTQSITNLRQETVRGVRGS
jgi:hypothetical protein